MKELPRRMRGSSLIEVLIALLLMAISTLGVLATQGSMARAEHAVAAREQAIWIADSVIEGLRGYADEAALLAQWRAYAVAVLPHPRILIHMRDARLATLVEHWTESNGHVSKRNTTCGETGKSGSCVTLSFAR